MKAIFDTADHPNVVFVEIPTMWIPRAMVSANFNKVRARFGHTLHVRELDQGSYPYQQLMGLLVHSHYDGWVLLEARTNPKDKVKAMLAQRNVFERMVAAHRS